MREKLPGRQDVFVDIEGVVLAHDLEVREDGRGPHVEHVLWQRLPTTFRRGQTGVGDGFEVRPDDDDVAADPQRAVRHVNGRLFDQRLSRIKNKINTLIRKFDPFSIFFNKWSCH